ncbi:hypothetical protein F4778DRAFT_91496 [Xylariomycetidae sp. FL2044]|nr:hypothetical protein F4778DRAFT_91496 [Xylariomycetidae sp. FL2044]
MAATGAFPASTSGRFADSIERPLVRELSLYNGVSNRSRGWKTRRSDKTMEPRVWNNPKVLRWDGASRSSAAWDNLRRDPELWFREGNCYIHLYGKGQSRRGPAFKVPFSALLEAKCYPLIDRFMTQNNARPGGRFLRDDGLVSYFGQAHSHSRIELFIPAPPHSDKNQSFHYHLATRNFFALIFRRSMVGENLGSALITLMHSMYEFRSRDVDHAQDMMGYLDEEGYLDLKNQPSHALAMLHLAEVFQLRNLYIDAFAHCCGMADHLFLGPEYQLVSSVTRKLIRRARIEMELRLGQCGSMLSTFLQDELSNAYLNLYSGTRAHLERFRTLLHGFYASRFGYYPPPSIDQRTTIFQVDVFRTMRADFEALYNYLVDDTFDVSQSSPFLAQGGICTLQSVQAFDARHKFHSLFHPLPLLPNIAKEEHSSRRVSWLGKQTRSSQNQRAHIHAALLRATNQHKSHLLTNELVKAYRRFEEDSVFSPMKADKLENLGPMDGRKVRWILIYTMYQVLRQATEPPIEVKDSAGVPYNLGISTRDLPPWRDDRTVQEILSAQNGQITRNPSTSTTDWSSSRTPPPPAEPSIEIKPDIDYLALSHRQETESSPFGPGVIRVESTRSSLARTLSRSSTMRRSLAIFTNKQQPPPEIPPQRARVKLRKPPYHEIVVHGYGNGTNSVQVTPSSSSSYQPSEKTAFGPIAGVPATSISDHSTDASIYPDSEAEDSIKTSDTSFTNSPTETSAFPWDFRQMHSASVDNDGDGRRSCRGAVVAPRSRSARPEMQRPHTLYEGSMSAMPMPMPMSMPMSIDPPTLPATSSTYSSSRSSSSSSSSSSSQPGKRRPLGIQGGNSRTKSHTRQVMEPMPLNIRKANNNTNNNTNTFSSSLPRNIQSPSPRTPTAWDYVKAVMEVKATGMIDDIHPQWEQYNDLGGFTEVVGMGVGMPGSGMMAGGRGVGGDNRRASTAF